MSKIKYHWKMSVEEAMRLAFSRALDIPEDELYAFLVDVFEEGEEHGYDKGWADAMMECREDKPEVKFDPIP